MSTLSPRDTSLHLDEQRRQEALHKSKMYESWINQVPSQFRDFDLTAINNGWEGRLPRGSVVQLKRWLVNTEPGFLLLQGPKGVGKSTLGVSIVSDIVQKTGSHALFKSVPSLLSEFSFRQDGYDPLKETSDVSILMLDDLGAGNEGITPHQMRSLWALIDARWGHSQYRRTIITTNMSIGNTNAGMGLAEWLGQSAWDRVSDEMTRVVMNGDSFRGMYQ